MTVSGITSSSTMYAEFQARQKELQQDMSDLSTALSTGDTAAAEKLVSKMESMKPKDAPSGTSGTNPMEADMAALDKALQSGDIDAAKSAFAKLKAGFENGAKNGPPPGATSSTSGSGTDVYASLFQSLSSSSSDSSDTNTLYSLLLGSNSNSSATTNTTAITALLERLAASSSSSTDTSSTSSVNITA